MPSTLTFTGKVGPARQLTTKVFPDVRKLAFDFDKRTLQVNYVETNGDPEEAILDMSGGTVTVSDTVTANQHAVTVSVS